MLFSCALLVLLSTGMQAQESAIYELSQVSSVKSFSASTQSQSSAPIKLFSAGSSSTLTVYLTEDFEAAWTGSPAAPPGWAQTRITNVGDGTPEGDAVDGEKDWQRNVNTGVATWLINASAAVTLPNAAVSGTGTLWMNDFNYGPTTSLGFGSRRLESPTMNLTTSTSPYARFWLYYPATAGSNNMRVMASSNGGTTWNAIMIYTSNATVNGTMASATPYQRINVLIPAAYRTATAKIGFEFTNIYGTQNVWIDDLAVEDFTPTTISAAATGNWSLGATWTGGVVPSADNNVTIPAGDTVTVDVNTARCQNLIVDGTLNFASTGVLLQPFGDMTISATGVYSAFNLTTGKITFLGGSLSNAGSLDNSVGAPTTWFTGGSASSFTNTGTLVNSRFGGTVLFANVAGVTINSAVTMTGAINLVMGAANPSGNLTLGNPVVAATQTVSVGKGTFSAAPTFAAGMTSRSVTYTQFFAQPQNAVTFTPGEEVQDISGTRTVTGTLTVTGFNNIALGYPLTVGTTTTGALSMARSILISTPTNLLTLAPFVAGTAGTAPSTATPAGTPGSYVVGPVRINFPATGTTTRNFPLGLGTALNGPTPSANVLKNVAIATTTAWASQTITATLEAPPSGTASAPLTALMGAYALRLNLNAGPDLPATATVAMRGKNYTFGNTDNLIGTQGELRVAQSTALTGPWSERSLTVAGGTFVNNTDYARTSATAAPGPIAPLTTNGEFFALATTAPAMVYDSSTTTQNTAAVTTNSTNQQIIGIRVYVTGALTPLTISQFNLNTTGTTSTSDITNAKIWSTGSSATFAATTQFGSTVPSPSGSYTITSGAPPTLLTGTNYFWLTYDIPTGATLNNFVDGECTSITVTGGAQIPLVTAPAGNRQIKAPLAGVYTIGNPVFGLIAGKEFTYERRTRTVLRPVAIESEQNNEAKDKIQNVEPVTRMVEMQEEYWVIMEGGKPYEGSYALPVTANDREKYGLGDNVLSTYLTITAALADLNPLGVSGPTSFLLNDATYPAETFPLTIDIAGLAPTAVNTVTFKPNAGVTSTVSGSSANGVFKLGAGADYITFDGSNNGTNSRNWTISNTNTVAATAAIWLSSGGAGLGATNNTIKNLNLSCGAVQSTGTIETFGIISSGATISVSSDGADNDNNTYSNNAITKARWGMWLRGAVANPNDNTMVSGNLIGPAAFGVDEIGKGGIALQHQNAATVTQNEVRFVGGDLANTTSGSDRVGIGLGAGDGWPAATSTVITGSSVTRNLVHDIVDERTFSAVGIGVAGSGTPSANTVANNVIYGVRADGTAGDQSLGISIAAGNGDKVVYNSILMTGDLDPAGSSTSSVSSAGIRITSTTPSNLLLKDNSIHVDVTSNTLTLKHFGIVAPSAAYLWGTGAADYNDYFVNAANPQMVLGGIGTAVPYTDVATLASWKLQFTPNQDANSIATDPLYAGPTNLQPFAGSPILAAGNPVSGVTVDYLGLTRSATVPSMGAYENGVSAAMTYTSSTTTQTNTSNVNIGSTNQQIIGMQVVMTGTASPLSATRFYFKTDGSTSASDIANAKVWYTGTSSVFATGTQFGSTVASPSGPFVVNGSQVLAGGTNYFWLAYDISGSAIHGQVVDGQCDSSIVNSVVRIPTVAAPAGSRTVSGVAVIVSRPDSLVKTLATNSSTTDTVVIKNTGNGPLTWSIADENARPVGQIIGTDRFAIAGPELPKGVDNGTSSGPITDAQGGPDAFGYKWIDSDEPGGPAFGWVDISGSGTMLDSNSAWVPTGTFPRWDEGYYGIQLPFTFNYYGVVKDSLFIGTNGNVMFQRPTGNIFTNAAFPTAAGPIDNHIGIWWDDLMCRIPGKVYYGTNGSDFVVQYDSIPLYSTTAWPANYTFQVILSPNGTVKTQYKNMGISAGTLTSSAIGIENATGTIGLGVVNNAAYMHNNLAIKFSLPDAPWLTESPLSGSVNPGDSVKVVITFNSTGLSDSTYLAVLKIASNDPVTPNRNIPVRLIVGGGTSTLNVAIASGWNLISNPVTNPIPGDSVRQLYPTALNAYAFEFAAGYVQKFKLANGKGYWEKFPGAISNPITGTLRTRDSVSVVTGWNIVGSISNTVDTSTIVSVPAGLRVSNWFGYSAGYTAVTQLVPGKGYWVKSAAPGGKFVLANPLVAKPAQTRTPEVEIADVLNTLTITDANGGSQTLYFGADGQKQIPVAMYTMPPAPPVGAFDARFETADGGSMVQTHGTELSTAVEFAVAVQSEAYPLTITWKVTNASYAFTDGVQSKDMTGEGSTKITNSSVNRFSVKLTGEGGLPKEFALSQNYPNPFNPTTNIKYALPVDSRVTMEIYNVIGQKVRTLVSDNQAAGYHAIEWNSTGTSGQQLGSGVYFLHLSARGVDGASFNEIRKLLLLK